MSKLLATSDVSITTTAIDIAVVRVGAKQMTLSVFRQLMRDDNVVGPIWGRVNYHPDKCSEERRHIHLIWQKDGELRRATLQRSDYLSLPRIIIDSFSDNGGGLFAAMYLEFTTQFFFGSVGYSSDYIQVSDYTYARGDVWLPYYTRESDRITRRTRIMRSIPDLNYRWYKSALRDVELDVKRACEFQVETMERARCKPSKWWWKRIQQLESKQRQAYNMRVKQWETLEAARQLFVAV